VGDEKSGVGGAEGDGGRRREGRRYKGLRRGEGGWRA